MSTATPDQPESVDTPEDEAERRMALVNEAVQAYGSYLLHYLLTLTRCREDAEDLYQDLFCLVLERFPEEKITHVGMLRNKAYQIYCDKWRRNDNYAVTAEEQPPEIHVAFEQEPLDEEAEQRFKLRFFDEHSFLGLTREQEDALWYHFRHQYTFREIGAIMERPPSTIGDWIARARQLFIEHLDVAR